MASVTPLPAVAPAAEAPPHDLDAEMSVLSAVLLSERAIADVAERLRPDHFYRGSHGTVYQTVLDMYGRGVPVDAVTLADELEKRGTLDDVGGRGKVAELAAWASATGNAAHYARIVKDMASLRALLRAGAEITRLARERGADVPELLDLAEQEVFALSQDDARTGLERLKAPLTDAFKRMQRLAENPAETVGLSCGYRRIDALTLGFKAGELIVLAARPSMGKSALAACMTVNVGVRQQLPVAFFSLEMNRASLVDRFLAIEANVDLRHVQTGPKEKAEWSRLAGVADRLANAPIWIDDSPSLSVIEVRSKARRLKAQQPGLALVVVDYLGQLVRGRFEHRTVETGAVALAMKQLARDLEVPVLLLAQLNRACEQRPNPHKRPVLSDLRDSGEVEQHADLVMFIYRDEVYNDAPESKGLAEVHVAKNRNGPTDRVKLTWIEDRAKFSELPA